MDTQVLIAGAGPTGLVLALWLARKGIRLRIIDESPGPPESSRALAVQSRTLELYRQLGIADEVVAAGLPLTAANFWAGGRKAAHIDFGTPGAAQSPYPYGLIFPQDEHERFLVRHLAELGVQVERNTRLLGFEDREGGVVARVEGSQCNAAFLAGCDGAHSAVRQGLGFGFPGGTYQHLFYVADVEAGGPLLDRQLHVSVDESDFVACFPLRENGRARLIGTVRPDAQIKGKELGWADVQHGVLRRLRIDVRRVRWFSTYPVHHRVANHFHKGRVLLLGDAGHIHSPVGGQGMNTGIGDAVNLAWKLAAVLKGEAPARLLDTYEPERIAFARRLVATTDRVFQFVTRAGWLAAKVRVQLVPPLLSAAFRREVVRRFLYRTVSQTSIQYRASALSRGAAGPVHGGDRLPWVAKGRDNFEPLESLSWQVHCYGRPSTGLRRACAARGLALHVFPFGPGAMAAGLRRSALYLVRPDGHVALADLHGDASALTFYLDAQGLRLVERSLPLDPTSASPASSHPEPRAT